MGHPGDDRDPEPLYVEQDRAVVARTPNLLELAGAIDVPAAKRGTRWDDVLRGTREARAGRRR